VALLLFGAPVARAQSEPLKQQFVHENWTANDGLPVNGTTDLTQSSDGYIWLATYDGLVRFDGVRFTVYNTGNSDGLSSNRIVELQEAPDGALWLLTGHGHVVRMRDGGFTSWGSQHDVGGWAANCIHIDHQGGVWAGTSQGVRRLEGDRMVEYEPDLIPPGIVVQVYLQSDGHLWVAAGGYAIRIKDGHASRISKSEMPCGGTPYDFYEDEEGAVWIASTRGVSRYKNGELSLVVPGGRFNGPSNIYASGDDDAVWVLSGTGVASCRNGTYAFFDAGGSTVLPRAIDHDRQGRACFAMGNRIYQDGEVVYRLPIDTHRDGGVAAILHDHEGSVWIATRRDGLHRLKPKILVTYSTPEGMNHQNIYPIAQDRLGDIWFGTWSEGINRLSNNVMSEVTTSGYVSAFHEDRDGRMWFGGINQFGYVEDNQLTIVNQVAGDPYPTVSAIHEDADGLLWVGTHEGLARLDGSRWQRFSADDGVPPGYVRVIAELSDGSLWMGTSTSGLLRYKDGQFDRLTTQHGLSSNLIRTLYEDADSVLWIGTEGRGLCRLEGWHGDLSDLSVTVLRQRDGLFDEGINQILEDDQGRLWMSSNRGIYWVPRDMLNHFARGEVRRVLSTSYGERDGMRSQETNGGASPAGVKANDGRLWFPTQDGAVVVDPASVHRNEVPPPVTVEAAAADGVPIVVSDGKMQLSRGQRDFAIEYTALSFMAPENMRFRYMLEGFNAHWVDAGTRRAAYYTNVPPGDYRFRVIASNNNGVWNETGANVSLSIAPYFYETAWFYSLVGLAMVGLGVLVYKRRTRQLETRATELANMVTARTRELQEALQTVEAQADKLKTLDHAKSNFFANISHEFRTPLTLTIGPLEDLVTGARGSLDEGTTEELDLALRNARRLLRLVNQILDVAKLEAGQMSLRAQRGDIVAFSKGVGLAFTPLAERRGIHFELDTPETPVYAFFDPDLLEKVLTNLLSNAFKFTDEAGRIRMAIEPDRDTVRLVVADNGPGIPPAVLPHIFERFYQASESQLQASTGIGLSLARELVELHRGHIDVSSEEGAGAAFTVTLPLGSAGLLPEQIVEPAGDAGPTGRPRVMVEDDVVLPDANSPAIPVGDASDGPIVMIVDDNAEIREYVRKILEPSYRVVDAVDGKQGLDIARSELPDLIVSDVMMPNMDGFELCAALKADPELDFIPLILLTAKATTGEKIEGLGKGADDYLTKPFDRNELIARVSNLIESRRRLRKRLAQARPSVHATTVDVTSSNDEFLDQLRRNIELEMGDEQFTVDALAERLTMSRGHLHRRLRDLLGETPTDVIRRVRLERAAQLLAGRSGSVSEVAYAVGFKSVSHFSKSFRDQFAMTPSQYAKSADNATS
jgi:signal transduction histidine kinase/ligand-binding sensor domain-containing protein/DNA-binding response OmpR family regulator